MTIRQLIEKLKTYNTETPLVVRWYEKGHSDISTVTPVRILPAELPDEDSGEYDEIYEGEPEYNEAIEVIELWGTNNYENICK